MELKRTLTKRMQKLSGLRRKDGDTSSASSITSNKKSIAPDSIELPPKRADVHTHSAPTTPITPGNEEEFLSISFEQAAPSPQRSTRPALVSARSSRSASVASHTQPHTAEVEASPRLMPHRSPRSRSSSGAALPATQATVPHSDSAPLLPSLTVPAGRRSSAGGAPLSPVSIHDENDADAAEMESAADEMAQIILDRVQNDTETQRWSL